MKKHVTSPFSRRGLSPIFATMILATIIIVFGSIAYYYANNITTSTTNSYVSTISNSQQSLSERTGFENVAYNSSSGKLTVAIINCGSANNVQINSVFIYDASHKIIGVYSVSTVPNPISALKTIEGGTPIPGNSLNIGKEAVFTVALSSGTSLSSSSMYTIQLITKSGSSSDYDFTV